MIKKNRTRRKVKMNYNNSGETVLIQGATGSAGMAALQVYF